MSRTDQKLELKVKFNVIPKTMLTSFSKHFAGLHLKNGLVKSEPGNFVITRMYGDNAETLYRLKPRNDDVWLLTFPKCGRIIFCKSHNMLEAKFNAIY